MTVRRLFLLSLLLVLAALPAVSQDQRRFLPGAITGFVQFSKGPGNINSAIVYLESDMGSVIQQIAPGGTGRFEFQNLQRTRYRVVAKAPGYRDAVQHVELIIVARQNVILVLVPERQDNPPTPTAAGPALVPVAALQVPEEARREFEKGQEAVKDNKTEEAIRAYRRAIELHPDYSDAYAALGTLYMDMQRWDDAEANLKKCVEINDQFAAAYAALGALYNRTGKAKEAIPVLERSLELNPNSWQAHFELSKALLAEGKVEEAEKHARRAQESAPNEPVVHVVLANALLGRQDLAGARGEFQQYLKLAPEGPLAGDVKRTMSEIEKRERQLSQQPAPPSASSAVPPAARREFSEGKRALDRRNLDLALKHFRKAVEIHPDYLDAHHSIGTILIDQQKWSAAEATFKHCLEMNPDYAPAHIALGALYNMERKPAEAIPELERGIELEPNSWQGHFELAQSFMAQGRPVQADPHAQRAHELRPEEPMVHLLLANVKLSRHDLQAARDELQHYLDRDPNGEMAPAVRQKLAEIDAALQQQGTAKP